MTKQNISRLVNKKIIHIEIISPDKFLLFIIFIKI